MLLVPVVLLTTDQIALSNDESLTKEFDTQIPSESYVYYQDTTADTYGVFVSGNYAYVAAHSSGLAVINISDPTNPGTPIYEDTTGTARDVFVSGDYAYVADDGGLAIVNISDPTAPETPVYEGSPGSAQDIYVSGDYAYVAAFMGGLAIIDISDPTNPGTRVYEDTTGIAWGVYVNGNYAYVADWDSGLAIIDISDPTNPGAPVYADTSGSAYGVYVDGDYAYVADMDWGLAVIDISDPTNPGTPVYENTPGLSYDVYVEGDYAYVADFASGLAVIDISDPTNPETPVYEDTTGWAWGVYVSGNYAYVADRSSGLAVIDISEQINPVTHAYADTTGSALDVFVSGDYAYLADDTSGLAIIDISDPTNPGTPGYEDTTGNAYGVYVDGNYAYVADYISGLAVIDISDPTNPGTPVYKNTVGESLGIYVSGDYAYIADGSTGLAVIDISDPTIPGNPVYESTTGYAYGVYVSGDYAFVANFASGLAVIDISDPTNPGTPVYADTTGGSKGVYVSGDYAYIADGIGGFAVVDISDSSNPGIPVYESTTGFGNRVYVSGDYAYVADVSGGLAVIDISDPTDPGTPVNEGTTGNAFGVYVDGNYAYIANGDSGLAVIQVRQRVDMVNPIITNVPSDLSVVIGYTGQSISWTATDVNPDTYSIELQGTGIVSGPTAWTSGSEITYNIPDSFGVGVYVYTVNFMDDYGNFRTESVTFTVGDDAINPIITIAPSDLTVEFGYTGQSLSWMATDTNPNTYTIELQGTGIVAGPTVWTSDVAIMYNIPDGFDVGAYVYTVNFTDDYDNYVTESVTFTVEDTTFPIITNVPSDLAVEFGYTGQSISWTATDSNPNTYTIELQGSGIVVATTAWASGNAITYNIPDGFDVGGYIYTVNFTDGGGNYVTESVTFAVGDTTDPTITNAPSDLTVEFGYTGQSISWTATDPNPNAYTIELQGTGIVITATAWVSGAAITYDIPDDFALGAYVYTVNFTDDYGNFIAESVTFTVEDTTLPAITNAPSDLAVEFGYTGQSISWTATDSNPNTYTIELQGSGIVVTPTTWISGTTITYIIPDGFEVGSYIYMVNFTDDGGNYITESVTFAVGDTTGPILTSTPNDITVEFGYTGQSISWTATDPNPNTYTIELIGSGIVEGPTIWTTGVAITYDIPDDFSLGVYDYSVNFTDDYGNFIIENVSFIVSDLTNPVIMGSLFDITVESDYTGQIIMWSAADSNPGTYTIELQGTGIVAGPTAWISDENIIYNIPDGFDVGVYVYTINFTDDYGNSISDNFTFTVEDTTDPTITSYPSDLTVEFEYTGQNISWTATDLNPSTYSIELNGSEIVAGPTAWTSGEAIIYDIPDDLAAGIYIYTITFMDDGGNIVTDSVTFTVEDDGGGIPGARFEMILLLSIGSVAAIIIIVKKKKCRSNME